MDRTLNVYTGWLPSSIQGVLLLTAAMMGLLSGCAGIRNQEPAKYETVVADKQHDTPTARQKHAEALVFLEGSHNSHGISKAQQLLNEALVADVTYGPAHNSLGTVYYLQNKLYLAAWEFEYAVKLMPNMAQPYNNLGLVYERAGKYEEAISYYSIAMSHDESDPEVIGNLVRARMITGDRGGDLKHMVSDLALYHPNSRWQRWARDQVELTNFKSDKIGQPSSWDNRKVPEALPQSVDDREEVPILQLQFPESLMTDAESLSQGV